MFNNRLALVNAIWLTIWHWLMCTLESGIDVGQGINVGPGKLGKKNKRRALNTHVLCSE